MTSQIQISGKSDSGIIFVVGGDDADDFLVNLSAVLGDRQAAEDVLTQAARLITPVTTTAQAVANLQTAGAQPYSAPPQAPPAPTYASPAPQGEAPIGANGKPKRWVPPGVSQKTGKPYQGFWGEDRN